MSGTAPPAVAVLRGRGVAKRWDAASGLAPLSFEAGEGEVVMVRGRSGSGKSTLLALLVGWCEPDGGTIERSGTSVGDVIVLEPVGGDAPPV